MCPSVALHLSKLQANQTLQRINQSVFGPSRCCMDFLGSPKSELQKMKSQLVAQETLLHALLQIQTPQALRQLQTHYAIQTEHTKANVLHSMASDVLYEQVLVHLADYSRTIEAAIQSQQA